MRAPPERVEAALILADELEDDGYLRVPLAEVAARHRLRPALAAAGLALVQACDPAGVGARSLRECLALQLRERDRLDPAMQALLDNLGAGGARPAGRARGALRRRRRGRGRHAGRAARRSTRSPGCASRRRRWRSAVPDVHVRRAPDGELDGGAQHRDAAAGAGQQRLCRAAPARRRGGARLRLGDAAPARAGWCAASSSGRAPSCKVATEIVQRQERFFEPRRRRAAAADPAGGRRAARAARINRESGGGRKVPRPATRGASSSATSSARRSRRSRAARPFPRRRCRSASAGWSQGEPAARHAVGRQNRGRS